MSNAVLRNILLLLQFELDFFKIVCITVEKRRGNMPVYPAVIEGLAEKLILDNSDLFIKVSGKDKKTDIAISALMWAMSEFTWEYSSNHLFEVTKNYLKNAYKFDYKASFRLDKNDSDDSVLKNIMMEIHDPYPYFVRPEVKKTQGKKAEDKKGQEKEAQEEIIKHNKKIKDNTKQIINALSDYLSLKHPAISVISPYLLSAFVFNDKYMKYRKNGESFYSSLARIDGDNRYKKESYKPKVSNENINRDIESIIKHYFDYPDLHRIKKIDSATYLPQKDEISKKYTALLGFLRFCENMTEFNFTLTALLFEKRTGLFSLCLRPSVSRILFPYGSIFDNSESSVSESSEELLTMHSLYYNLINDKNFLLNAFQYIQEFDILHDELAYFFCDSNLPSNSEIIYKFIPAYKKHAFYRTLAEKKSLSARYKAEDDWWKEILKEGEQLYLYTLDDDNDDRKSLSELMEEDDKYIGDIE